jgi:arylsulfatase A-like enzyme
VVTGMPAVQGGYDGGEQGAIMNLIVVVADSLRVDHVGCYGGLPITPNIDDFAAECAIMEQVYGENLPTQPCRNAWWTGMHFFPTRGWQPLENDDVLLAELLSYRGYASALVTDTYHLHRPGYNNGRGFDMVQFIRGQEYDPWVVDEISVNVDRYHRLRGDDADDMWRARFSQYLRNRTRFSSEEEHCAPRVFRAAIDWLEKMAGKQKDRLFLWLDSFSPHEPWDPPEPFRSMYDPEYTGQEIIDPVPGIVAGYMTSDEVEHTKSLYAGSASLVDKWFGVLVRVLKELGLYENSLVIFASDHGEPFGEHGIIRKAGPSCYEELTHIPLLIRHPDGLGAGGRFHAFTQPPDLLPTIADLLSLRFGENAPAWWGDTRGNTRPAWTGRSLVPVLRGEKKRLWDFVVSAYHGRQWSTRTREWTLIHNLDSKPDELYRRDRDAGETSNIIAEHPDAAAELLSRTEEFAQSVAERRGT